MCIYIYIYMLNHAQGTYTQAILIKSILCKWNTQDVQWNLFSKLDNLTSADVTKKNLENDIKSFSSKNIS